MTSEKISPGSSRAVGQPVSINAPQSYGQVIARCSGRIERLTAKLDRQKDKGAPDSSIAETEAAIDTWSRKLRGTKILAGEDE